MAQLTLPLAVQYLIVALAVLWSAGYVARRQWPHAVQRARGRLALWLVRPARPVWAQRLGRRIAPPPAAATDACGGCNGCAPH